MISTLLSLSILLSAQFNAGNSGYTISFSMDKAPGRDAGRVVWLSSEGEPDVPSYVYKIGIPQGSTVDVATSNLTEVVIRDTVIGPVLYPGIYEPPAPKDIDYFGAVYARNALFPQNLIEVSEPAFFRDLYVVTVRLNPVRYNPVTREARIVKRVAIHIRFSGVPQHNPSTDDSFDDIYERTIVNYEQCKTWRRAAAPQPMLQNLFTTGVWYRIEADSEGLYVISYDQIQAAGIDPAQFDPGTIKMYTAAFNLLPKDVTAPFADSLVQVPVFVRGEGDNSFDRGDYVLFYAFPASHLEVDNGNVSWYANPYARNNVYWFTFGGALGERMETIDATWNGTTPDSTVREVLHIEEDRGNETRSGINWFWLGVSPGSSPSANITVPIGHPRARGLADVVVGVFTESLGSFIYDCEIGGERFFYDTLSLPRKVSLPPNYIGGSGFLSGDSSDFAFTITRPAGTTVNLRTLFDMIDLQYTRAAEINAPFHAWFAQETTYTIRCTDASSEPFILDITDPRSPLMFDNYTSDGSTVTLSGSADSLRLLYFSKYDLARPAELIAANPGRLRQPAVGCEYLFITHENFYNAIMPLVEYRTQEYTTQVVRVHDIYDDFSFGRYEPLAIKHFLYYVYNNWTTVPTFVLLVGDGTYDYKNNLSKPNPPNFIPMYEQNSIIFGNAGIPPNYIYEGEYVNFFGTGELMVLGRTTVRTQQEVRDFTDKVITYETRDIDGMWNNRLILAGDDEYSNSYGWEGPYTHCGPCESIADTVSNSLYSFAKVYMISYAGNNQGIFTYPTKKPDAEAAFIRELTKGAYAGVFFGHGNTHQLADEQLFWASTDIPQIKNGRRQYLFYFGSCTVGRFDDTDHECIGEELVRIRDGAIGTLASSCGTGPGTNSTIGRQLFNSITDTASNLTMGEHCFIARDGSWGAKYLLLGDPATKMRMIRQDMQLTASPESLRPLEQLRIATDQNDHYLTAFIRDADTIRALDSTTAYSIAGYVWREVQTGASTYVPFGYTIDGREIYQGYWDDTATIIVPQVSTSNDPVIKVYSHRQPRGAMIDSIGVYGSASPSSDETGPRVSLYDGGRKLTDNDWVERECTLTGTVSDTSGIYLLHPTESALGFFLEINGAIGERIDLRHYFKYDRNSQSTGEFTAQISLPEDENTVVVNVADNVGNQTIDTLHLNVEQRGEIAIDNFLVYPNPLKDDGGLWFTFDLTSPGTAVIKVFTIAGRRIRTIENVSCQSGYNQIYWDVRDTYMDEISNGAYLVKVTVSSGMARDEKVEKFIIAR